MLSDLQLSWVMLEKSNNTTVNGRYLDYLVSGHSLKEHLGLSEKNYVTPFGWFHNKEAELNALKAMRLQIKTELIENRVEFYICSECGDIGCGSITARISEYGDRIIWSDFAAQSSPDDTGSLFEVETLEFDRRKYFHALSQIK